ncbi:MAG: hypothetical protein A2173_01825 [Planctomycetes bacterium RBG_13_44_8b]|nr:MAG: hypothetical protein A2173_01825 [Planctomycetes bacterium RBG_13_44_8b]
MDDESISENQYIGKITAGIKLRMLQLAIINFVLQQLPYWRDDPDRADEKSERLLNSQLSKYLNSPNIHNIFPMICFSHEEPQYGSRDIDIAAIPSEKFIIEAKEYSKYDTVLVFECKRLPAPEVEREKEYVAGNDPRKISGGIQRFKLGFHGDKHDLAAIIGYVQDKTCHYWQDKINEWILELVKKPIGDGCNWNPNEILSMIKENMSAGVTYYLSSHNRTSKANSKIELHHLWVVMKNEKE